MQLSINPCSASLVLVLLFTAKIEGWIMNIPETYLSFSPSLAKTIGLEEAIVLQWLYSLSPIDSYSGFLVDFKLCQNRLSFLNIESLDSVFVRLQALGLIHLERNSNGIWQGYIKQKTENNARPNPVEAQKMEPQPVQAQETLNVTSNVVSKKLNNAALENIQNKTNQTRQRNQNPSTQLNYLRGQSAKTPVTGLQPMHDQWEPSQHFNELLQFHNIDQRFALEQLSNFRVYYVQSGKTAFSWDTRFINWVQRAWADQVNKEGKYEKSKADQSGQWDAKQRKEAVRKQLRDIHDTSWAE